jgi:acetyltransferase-like isoleucine patch superfamily enzyme
MRATQFGGNSMAFLSEQDLRGLGLKKLGRDVQISSRASIYNPELISVGDHSRIDDYCVVSGNVTIGRNVHFAVFCNVAGGEAGIVFEDFSGLAYGAHVFAQSDDYSGRTLTNPTVPDIYKSEIKKPVRIGTHCIVGTSSVILPGIELAEGTAVGAMSMVTKATRPWSIYFGIPAKRIRERSRDLLSLERQFLEQESCRVSELSLAGPRTETGGIE